MGKHNNYPILNEKIKGNKFKLVGVEDTKEKVETGIIDRKTLFNIANNLDLDVL